MTLHIGLDTETHRGAAVLVSTPSVDMLFPETFTDVIRWLHTQGESFVCWNANYDIRAILKLLPNEDALRTLGLTTRLEWDGLKIRYVPNKYMRVTWGHRHKVTIYDVQQFYGGSLDRAAKKHLGEGKLELSDQLAAYLKSGLLGNALKDDKTREECREYCMIDAKRCEQLSELMRESVEAAGLQFDQPVSCAKLARMKWGGKLVGNAPWRLHKRYQDTFRGGRMEVTKRGYIPEVRAWDIHSAYPSVLVNLPAPLDCEEVAKEKDLRPDAVYAAAYCYFRLPEGAPNYPVPVKGRSGLLWYPFGKFPAWVDADTIRVTRDLFGYDSVEVLHIHQFIQVRESQPFAEMDAIYKQRKADPKANLALKLVLNSTYGLLAEKLGEYKPAKGRAILLDDVYMNGQFYRRKDRPGPGANPIVAAKITGMTRARLLRETWDCNVISFATDGVIMEGDHKPSGPIDDKLGSWGDDGQGDCLIVGSGVYAFRDHGEELWDFHDKTEWDVPGMEWHTKSRGFAYLRNLPEILQQNKMRSVIPMPELRAKTLREFARNPNTRIEDMNYLKDSRKFLNLDFDEKRYWFDETPRARDLLNGAQESSPLFALHPPRIMKDDPFGRTRKGQRGK